MSNEIVEFSKFAEKLKENKECSFFVTFEKENSDMGIDEIIATASVSKGHVIITTVGGK